MACGCDFGFGFISFIIVVINGLSKVCRESSFLSFCQKPITIMFCLMVRDLVAASSSVPQAIWAISVRGYICVSGYLKSVVFLKKKIQSRRRVIAKAVEQRDPVVMEADKMTRVWPINHVFSRRVEPPLKLSWRLSALNAALKITEKELHLLPSCFSAPLISCSLYSRYIWAWSVLTSLTGSWVEGVGKERVRSKWRMRLSNLEKCLCTCLGMNPPPQKK